METALYTADDGQVLITNRRLILGGESWPLESVRSAELKESKTFGLARFRMDRPIIVGVAQMAFCFLLGAVLFNLALTSGSDPYSNWFDIALGMALFLMGIGIAIHTYWLLLPSNYNLHLALHDPATGGRSEQTATYVWRDEAHARNVEQAVQAAIRER
jgi:hypothetical protein